MDISFVIIFILGFSGLLFYIRYWTSKDDPKPKEHTHFWKIQSNDALIGYYCECGLEDWYNDYQPNLRNSWLESRIRIENKK